MAGKLNTKPYRGHYGETAKSGVKYENLYLLHLPYVLPNKEEITPIFVCFDLKSVR